MRNFKNYLGLVTLGMVMCFSLTGCGNNTTNGSTSGNNDNNVVEDVANDAGNAVEDVADGVGNAVNDLVGNGGFNNYNDAKDYFMNTMSSYHADAKFEIRDENQELNDYQEGSKGYRFNLYDTSTDQNGTLFGEFYVDANSGMIYRKDENGNITEYPVTNNGNAGQNNGNAGQNNGNATDNNGANTNGNGTGNNGAGNTNQTTNNGGTGNTTGNAAAGSRSNGSTDGATTGNNK